MLLRVLQRLAQRLNFFRLLGLNIEQDLTLFHQGLHTVGIAPDTGLSTRAREDFSVFKAHCRSWK